MSDGRSTVGAQERFDLSTGAGRWRARLDYLWRDHAWIRLGFSNAHWITPTMARANQPWPFQLGAWRDNGVRTVINLRGGLASSFHVLEREACERLGLTLVNFTVASREIPSREQIFGARELFETIAYPAMMHCKSGADRAGLMAVLFMHFHEGQSIRQALGQLSPRYLHVRAGLTGVLDFLFETYLAEGESAGLSFAEWVESEAYDAAALKARFEAGWWGTLLSERLLRRE